MLLSRFNLIFQWKFGKQLPECLKFELSENISAQNFNLNRGIADLHSIRTLFSICQ